MKPRPILFDTDIGSDVDDALALALVLARPEALELVAVTTVADDPQLAARIAASLLGAAGRREVEVCAGEGRPLLRRRRFNRFGHEERCIVAGPASPVSAEAAPERIVRAAFETPGLELVLVGPLTNLARALALDPELPRRVRGICVMGGHVREVRIGDYLCAPGIDYNLCCDPEAAVAVLGAGFATRLVTADVTVKTWLRERDLGALAASHPLGPALIDQVRLWTPIQRRIFSGLGGRLAEDNVAFLHDPLTVLALIDGAPLRFEDLRIVPTVENGVLRTLEVDGSAGLGAAMQVATGVDAGAAERAILGALTSRREP